MVFFRAPGAVILGILLTSISAPAVENPNQLSPSVQTILENATKFEMLSLDPGFRKEKPKDNFHGWKVLGSTFVQDKKARGKVMAALTTGIKESDGRVAKCFRPRHGIRATHKGRTVDLVICFECLQVQVFGGKKATTVLTTNTPQTVFDKVLREAKVPLPRPAK